MKPFLYAAILAALLLATPSTTEAHDRCPSYTYETVMWNGWYYIRTCRPYVKHHRHRAYHRHYVHRAPRSYARPHRHSPPPRRHHPRRRR